jgi:hypothetical protein
VKNPDRRFIFVKLLTADISVGEIEAANSLCRGRQKHTISERGRIANSRKTFRAIHLQDTSLNEVQNPQVGTIAEDFTLPDSTGTPRILSFLLADGALLLIFYRGYW